MRSSGHIQQKSKPEKVSATNEGNLSAVQVLELDTLYQHLLPQFSKLGEEYKEDGQRCKRISNFPGRKVWTPQARQLSLTERVFAGRTG